jgi:hypothetical protein
VKAQKLAQKAKFFAIADGCCSWTADDKRLLPLPFPTMLLLPPAKNKNT